jgi:hydrogenase nickel incorporation protein HypA/HybF
MHELSIASAIAESVLDFVSSQSVKKGQSVKKVLAVKLAIGELRHIEGEQLRFCYTAITEETPIQGSALEIERIEAVVRCDRCSYTGRPKYWDDALAFAPILTLECPNCGGAVEAIAGNDCAIKSIRFATEDDD